MPDNHIAPVRFPEVDAPLRRLREFGDNLYHDSASSRSDRPRMVPTKGFIEGRAFFPGGSGVRGSVFPVGEIMVLGQDFDTLEKFEAARRNGQELASNATWTNMLALLQRVDVNEQDCFFTNAYMGVRTGKKSNGKPVSCTGANPSRSYLPYVAMCEEMFLYQLNVQKPRLIIALGTYVPQFLANLAPALAGWMRKSFKKRDDTLPAVPCVEFPVRGAIGRSHTCIAASSLHPSLRNGNLRRRSYSGLKGDEAEIQILRDALTRSDYVPKGLRLGYQSRLSWL